MRILRESAPAKLNLTLDVLAKRPDGYHDLQSIMQSVSLRDEISIEIGTGKAWELHCDREDIPCDRRNLGWKAAVAFCEALHWDPDGLKITVTKRIPSEAGLGGGSSDAAAVLRLLNRCVPQPLSGTELADLGARVGSDVPFCVMGGTAFCEGRGERLTPLETESKLSYVLCKPDLAFSTPKLFAKLDSSVIVRRPNHRAMEQALRAGNTDAIGHLLCNVFEDAVTAEYQDIIRIKEILLQCGACGAQMTGSGSVVFGVFHTDQAALEGAEVLKKAYPNTYFCKTV